MQCENIWFAYVGFQFRLYQNFREIYNCQRANTYYRNLWAFIEIGLVWQQSASTCSVFSSKPITSIFFINAQHNWQICGEIQRFLKVFFCWFSVCSQQFHRHLYLRHFMRMGLSWISFQKLQKNTDSFLSREKTSNWSDGKNLPSKISSFRSNLKVAQHQVHVEPNETTFAWPTLTFTSKLFLFALFM